MVILRFLDNMGAKLIDFTPIPSIKSVAQALVSCAGMEKNEAVVAANKIYEDAIR